MSNATTNTVRRAVNHEVAIRAFELALIDMSEDFGVDARAAYDVIQNIRGQMRDKVMLAACVEALGKEADTFAATLPFQGVRHG